MVQRLAFITYRIALSLHFRFALRYVMQYDDVMSEQQMETARRMCRFPGCQRPAMEAEADTGRPPEYCDDPKHTRAAAWRARRRLAAVDEGFTADEARPVDAARQRASAITGQVAGMIEHLEQQLATLVGELRTVTDPEAVEAQLESASTEAAEHVAAANARAARAEQAQRRAAAEREEADAAAAEATDQVDELTQELAGARAAFSEAVEAEERVTKELAEVRAAAENDRARAVDEAEKLRAELAAARGDLTRAEDERDAAAQRAQTAEDARLEAEQRAAAAESRAAAETARSERAEAENTHVREQLDATRAELDQARETAGDLRSTLATITAERDAANVDVGRERAHADQRIQDLRTTYDRQIDQLRDELSQARGESPTAGRTAGRRTTKDAGETKPTA